MSKNKKIGLLILILCIFVTGCTTNKNAESTNLNEESKSEANKESTNKSLITEDKYKTLLTKNYEKYIKPIELKYDNNLDELLASKNEIDNVEFLYELKTIINDNRINLKSFEESMVDLDIKDSMIEEINNKILKECKVYIRDLDNKENYLNRVDDDILAKPNNEFIKYIQDILDKDELEESKLEEAINEAEDLLGIQLEYESLND